MELGNHKKTRIKVNGKFSFESLSPDMKLAIKKRLVEKDPIMERASRGELPGIKINGKVVTKDNIKEFEINPKVKKIEKEGEQKEMSKNDLFKLSFSKLKEIAEKLGETGRSKSGLIKDILKHR